MGLKPLRDLLYLIPIDTPPVSQSGLIFIPHSAQQNCYQGIVKYRGPLTTGEVRVGDHVFLSKWAGDEILVEGEGRLIVLKEEHVEAIHDGKEDVYLLSIEQIQHAITVAAAEEAGRAKPEHKQVVLDTAKHIKEVIGDHFQRSLY